MKTGMRVHLEMAEAEHGGPMRLYAAEITAYLQALIQLIGKDERVCRVCGAVSHLPDGTKTLHWFYQSADGATFCDTHRFEFEAHIERASRLPQ